MKKIEYGDVCKVTKGFYRGCLFRVLKKRLFGLWYRGTIINPYFADATRIWGFVLKLHRKANKD